MTPPARRPRRRAAALAPVLAPVQAPVLAAVLAVVLAGQWLAPRALARASLASAPPAAAADEPFVDLSLQDASARAEKSDRLLVVYFHRDDEPECRRMVEQTFADEKVRQWIDEYAIAVQFGDQDTTAIRRFNVRHYPLTMVMRPNFSLLHRARSFQGPADFLVAADLALLATRVATKPEGDDLNNPSAWLAWANWLFANHPDKSEDCLEAYLWCLDGDEKHEPGFRDKHFEFICQRVALLKTYTPQAGIELAMRRNDLVDLMMAGTHGERTVWEVWRYNFWVRDDIANLQIFDALKDQGPKQREARLALMRFTLDLVVAHERYEDVLALVPDSLAEIDARLTDLAREEVPSIVVRADIVSDAVCFYECLLHDGRGADAKQLLERVTDAVKTGRAYAAFIERSNRLAFYQLSLQTADKGLGIVSDKGQRLIRSSIRLIPKELLEAHDGPSGKKGGDGR